MRRNSDIASSKAPDALESATNSVMVPHQVLQYWKQLDRPEADGWETEVLAQAADQQLKNLGKILIKPKALDLDSLVGLVTKQCLCSGLMPVKVKTVFSSDLLDVTRAAVGSSGADESGLEFSHTEYRPILVLYEQMLCVKQAAEICGLSRQNIEDIFWGNASRALGLESTESAKAVST